MHEKVEIVGAKGREERCEARQGRVELLGRLFVISRISFLALRGIDGKTRTDVL